MLCNYLKEMCSLAFSGVKTVKNILITFLLIGIIPVFGYNAVIWCEPIIWCVMATQLLISFFMNPYIRNKLLPKAADAAKNSCEPP